MRSGQDTPRPKWDRRCVSCAGKYQRKIKVTTPAFGDCHDSGILPKIHRGSLYSKAFVVKDSGVHLKGILIRSLAGTLFALASLSLCADSLDLIGARVLRQIDPALLG